MSRNAGGMPGAKILVVEDDPQVAALLCCMLSFHGHRVRAVTTVREAMACLGEDAPELLLLDLQLQDGHGRAVLDHLRARPETTLVPAIVLSGAGGRDDRLWAMGSGVTDWMPKPFDPEELELRIRGLLRTKRLTDRLEYAETVLAALARTIDSRDPHTHGHSERVARYATALALAAGLDELDVATVDLGARYHDVGKIAVPDRVLFKPGRLEGEEIEQMRRHPVEGWRMLEPVKALERALPIVRHHHERMDGSGYPDGLSGGGIPLVARVTSVADVFDALTSPRSYRQAMEPGRAIAVLRDEAARGWWDPDLVATFAAIAPDLLAQEAA